MRLFVAVRLPDDVAERLAAFDRAGDPSLRWTTSEQWHVTLRFLGNVDDVAIVSQALRQVEGFGAVDARIGPSAIVLSRHTVCLPVDGLVALAEAVVDATRAIGDPPPTRPFRGHVTLARAKGRVHVAPPVAIDARWPVGEIELVHSHLERGGARYETLETFRL